MAGDRRKRRSPSSPLHALRLRDRAVALVLLAVASGCGGGEGEPVRSGSGELQVSLHRISPLGDAPSLVMIEVQDSADKTVATTTYVVRNAPTADVIEASLAPGAYSAVGKRFECSLSDGCASPLGATLWECRTTATVNDGARTTVGFDLEDPGEACASSTIASSGEPSG